MVLLLLALLSGGLAHASHPFDNIARASDEELDRMRGGFVVNWNGQVFLMPFSIDGIERLTQINGQTFINGALVSPKVNPQALIPFTQSGQISVNASTSPPIGGDPLAVAQTDNLPLPGGAPPADSPAVSAETNAGSAGSDGDSLTPVPTSTNTNTANAQVTTQGSLIVIQNGVANSVALPPGTSLDSLATIIQNSVNDQVIRNITTMNITIDARMLAAQSRLDAILSQHGLR
ncbi:MAG: hypothetical protein ACYCY9_00730 [Thiobacillus sp.]